MIHAISYILFAPLFTAWLGHELKKSYSLTKHWRWLAGAFVTGIVGGTVYIIYPDNYGNFVMHMSGGVASTILFIYATKTLNLRFNWRLTALLIFGFVSMLGVLNEFYEFASELLGYGPMSLDTQDTWRDFVANTLGAYLAWGVYLALQALNKRKSQ